MCSKCKRSTSGPSDESPSAVTNIGVAAHISSAASGQGARRYDPNMTSEERRHISNGIWLCASCSVLIDRDEERFTIAELRRIRDEHEASRRIDGDNEIDRSEVIAIGRDIITVGDILSTGREGFKVRLLHFVQGSGRDLIRFANEFQQTDVGDRYVLLNELGYGGLLADTPSVSRQGIHYELEFTFSDRTPRRNATQNIVSMCAETGRLIEGMDALAQNFEQTLGMARGEWFADLELGSHLADLYWRYHGSPWFEPLAMNEIVRLASIPKRNRLTRADATPFLCVNRVNRVCVPSFELEEQKLQIEVDFEVEGLGDWSGVLSVFISTPEQLMEARARAAQYAANSGQCRRRIWRHAPNYIWLFYL